MRLARNIVALENIAGILVGFGVGLLALGLGLVRNWEALRLFGATFPAWVRPGAPDGLTIAAGAVACAIVATGVARLRDILRLDVRATPEVVSDGWSEVARAHGLPRAIVWVLIAALVAALAGAVFVTLVTGNALALSLRVLGVLLLYGVTLWLLVRPPRFLLTLRHTLDRALRRGQPTYTLTAEGVSIDLRRARRGKPGSQPVLLRFDELSDVRRLTYVTAMAYVRYEVGPNLTLALRQTEDVARFFRGDIPRPRVYAMGVPTIAGRHVLLRGPELFYLIAFDCDDAEDLVNAFRAARGRVAPAA